MSDPIHVVCSKCDGVVRVPADRAADAPQCPKCHVPLFEGKPFDLREDTFERHIARNDLPVIVDFWAPWCGPCRMMAPHFSQAAARHAGTLRFAKVNSDEAPAVSARFGIRSIPTVIAFRGGKELARQSGAMDLNTLERWIASATR